MLDESATSSSLEGDACVGDYMWRLQAQSSLATRVSLP